MIVKLVANLCLLNGVCRVCCLCCLCCLSSLSGGCLLRDGLRELQLRHAGRVSGRLSGSRGGYVLGEHRRLGRVLVGEVEKRACNNGDN